MKITLAKIEYKDVINSHNIKQGIDIYISRLNKILPRIVNGCTGNKYEPERNFNNCSTCQSDYSVQFLDIAICILFEDGIIDKQTKDNIMSKLYDGHRG